MNYTKLEWWERFKKYYTEFPEIGLAIDFSRTDVDEAFLASMEPKIKRAMADMSALEKGAIANPDENRMVGHYWLRNPALAPTPEIRKEIEDCIVKIKNFSAQIHSGEIQGAGGKFKNLLLIGIGGSALGPQFVAHALGDPRTDKLKSFFFDNTDPNGMERVLATIGDELDKTLCIVISKSGGTKETRNGMLIAKAAFEKAGVNFGKHSVAVTTLGSQLDKIAVQDNWLTRFPMWDWIGGRTSELSAVGLLPAALQGFEISDLLFGAKACDEITRNNNVKLNPSVQLSVGWYKLGNGKGKKNMVILPYKDRLELFSKYLQQLVMESLGKELDLNKNIVNQGITVLGNKGSTDQHSYIQQLRDGLNDFFVTFIEVLKDNGYENVEVEPNTTCGDFLHGLYLGTRQALIEKDRKSITIILKEVSPFTVGALIALFERAVGIYASLININAYHQPGVEAGKKAADNVINIQNKILTFLKQNAGQKYSIDEIGKELNIDEDKELIFKICEYLTANSNNERDIQKFGGQSFFTAKYGSN